MGLGIRRGGWKGFVKSSRQKRIDAREESSVCMSQSSRA
jgi:hypothetical protein